MDFSEKIQLVKQIDIRTILDKFEIQYKEGHGRVMFRLREEDHEPSVSAVSQNGIWVFRDFGDATIRGTVIDLYMYITGTTFKQAVEDLFELIDSNNIAKIDSNNIVKSKEYQAENTQEQKQNNSNKVEIIRVSSFFLDAQKEYLKKRCVWPPIKELKNIQYRVKGKTYYGIGMQMINGHYVIRVPFENSSIRYIYSGPSDILVLEGQSQTIYIVEGLFDGLSMKKLFPEDNIIILNSVKNRHKAVSFLNNFDLEDCKIFLALDNDEAGREAALDLYEDLPNTEFFLYSGKDPNEYLLYCMSHMSSLNP